MHLRCSLVTVVAIVALASSTARAEEEWYGYQVAAPDVVGSVLLLAGIQSESVGAGALGVSGMFFGGPIVHAAHGHWGRAGASFGLRVGAPFLGAILGGPLGAGGKSGKHALDGIVYAIFGAGLGYVAAAVFDIAYLAYEDVPEARPRMFSIGARF
jgi:hypothetical protein